MNQEIERKFLLKSGITLSDLTIITQAAQNRYDIKEHYFNEFTRLRFINDRGVITIKSAGTLKRNEFEYEVLAGTHCPDIFMCKLRYCIGYLNHTFELNIFSQFKDETGTMPLCLIEVELTDENEKVSLPFWVGEEVTEDKKYYGYNLFKRLEKIVQ